MSWSWYIYSALPAAEVISLEADYERSLAEFLEEHPDSEDEYAETTAGGPAPPSVDEVCGCRHKFGDAVAEPIRTRLARCRSTVSFDHVRDAATDDPLQVSILRFWLERLGPSGSLVDWGEYSLELGDDVLAKLKRAKSRGRLGAAPPPRPRRVHRRAERPGELRAVAILDLFGRAHSEPELAIDLTRTLGSLSDGARKYVQLLVQDGPVPDSVAVRKLGVSSESLRTMIDEIERALTGIKDE